MADSAHDPVIAAIQKILGQSVEMAEANLAWLQTRMHPYFFSCNSEDVEAVSVLAADLHLLERNRRFILADNDRNLIIAQLGEPGAVHDALRSLPERSISYAQMHTSYGNVPNTKLPARGAGVFFRLGRRASAAPRSRRTMKSRPSLVQAVQEEAVARYPDFPADEVPALLDSCGEQQKICSNLAAGADRPGCSGCSGRCRSLGGIHVDVEEGQGVDHAGIAAAVRCRRSAR